jgi:hypothetical protein
MLGFDAERVWQNVRKATTEDLLDRATVYRSGMEPEALEIIEAELHRRGVDAAAVDEHETRYRRALIGTDGTPLQCSFCRKPAVIRRWGWHRLWKKLPVFPRPLRYCEEHWEAFA